VVITSIARSCLTPSSSGSSGTRPSRPNAHIFTRNPPRIVVSKGAGSRPENKKLNEALLYCSALLRLIELPVEMCTPLGPSQSLHLDSLGPSFWPWRSTIFAESPFVMPEDSTFRQSIPVRFRSPCNSGTRWLRIPPRSLLGLRTWPTQIAMCFKFYSRGLAACSCHVLQH